ncbi:hypothetical protein PanWU01x14_099090 [Parasponia andersonii]|uniref:Uncharacterized protein n=1 Tax=Parasponia andersonii TaxID=3476 RepID=A0A2P5D3M9_PARAD|nr:hypothetical protein PanWU01x14_099090 [Parasponia andersonii]
MLQNLPDFSSRLTSNDVTKQNSFRDGRHQPAHQELIRSHPELKFGIHHLYWIAITMILHNEPRRTRSGSEKKNIKVVSSNRWKHLRTPIRVLTSIKTKSKRCESSRKRKLRTTTGTEDPCRDLELELELELENAVGRDKERQEWLLIPG